MNIFSRIGFQRLLIWNVTLAIRCLASHRDNRAAHLHTMNPAENNLSCRFLQIACVPYAEAEFGKELRLIGIAVFE